MGYWVVGPFFKAGMHRDEWNRVRALFWGCMGLGYVGMYVGWMYWGPLTFEWGQNWGWEGSSWLPNTRMIWIRLMQTSLCAGFLLSALGFFWLSVYWGFLSWGSISQLRKVVYVVVLAVAALLTPPDVMSQLVVAGPTFLVLEGGLWLLAVFYARKHTERTASK